MTAPWTCEEVVKRLKLMGDPKAVEGAARFGIRVSGILGVSAPISADSPGKSAKTTPSPAGCGRRAFTRRESWPP